MGTNVSEEYTNFILRVEEETTASFGTLISVYQTTRRHITENIYLNNVLNKCSTIHPNIYEVYMHTPSNT
jgi:hypothetical protein